MTKVVNLDHTEEVREYLAKKEGKNSYIEDLVDSCDRYARYNKIVWNKPLVKRSSQSPYVPTEEENTIMTTRAPKPK
jgi:hypothetical protein